MAVLSVRRKHVHVQLIRRKSFKRRSKRAKHRKRNTKSVHVARSLITPSLLKQNTHITHRSIARIPSLTIEKIERNQRKKNRRFSQIQIMNQQSIDHVKTQVDNIQSLKHPNDQNLQTFDIFPSNQTHHLPLSLHPFNRKNTNLLHGTMTVSTASLTNKSFTTKTRSNKKSSVHPYNEQQNYSPLQKKKKQRCSSFTFAMVCIFLGLLLAGIIAAIVIPLMIRKDIPVTSTAMTVVTTTTTTPVCTNSSHMVCSTVMFHYLNVGYSPPLSWTLVSCCYISPTINQTTFEIIVQEDSGYWLLDDVSATQGNGELISNGGFESNMTNWTLIIYSNATSSTIADYTLGSSHTGLGYLYGALINAYTYVKQTFPVIQGQNILISFWWNYFPAFGFPSGVSELGITLT